MSVPIILGSAARRGKGISASAAADLIASHAPLRARRKSPWGKKVGTKHVRLNVPHEVRGSKGTAVPLVALSPLSVNTERGSPKGLRQAERLVKTYHLNDGTICSP